MQSRKIMQCFLTLCYNEGKSRGVMQMMPEIVMKELFDKANIDSLALNQKKEKRSIKIFSKIINYFYYLELKQVSKTINYAMYLEKNKEICNGKVVIKGTRIQPITIANYFLANSLKYKNDASLFFEDIKKSYPTLNEQEILVSLLYCTCTTKVKKRKIFE